MNSNYPPGVTDSTYGAPFNDEVYEFSIECSGVVQGPLNKEDYDKIVSDIKKEVADAIRNIINDFEII